MVCKDTTLRYFDSQKQVDASQKGLGAALLQDGCPITFASKALTLMEQRYANIECEMLACVFGAEWFHTYVFGRSFTIESDHKPLEQINLKNLADTPARLQRMLLCLQNYDMKITYRPSREMLVADTLSRYASMPAPEVALDLAIHHMHITPEKKLAFQQSIQDDPLLCSLAETIIAGWPEDIKDLPNALWPYHTYQDVMTVEDGLILRREALIILPSERGKVLESIHKGHLGISKCQFQARQCVYWPGINADIRKMVEACPTCLRHCPQEPWQPLQSTPAPERPWQHLGADYFSFDGSDYLVIVNYYTKMPFVRKMSPSQCNSAWNSRSNPDGQRPTVCQPPVCRVHQGLEHRPHPEFPKEPEKQRSSRVSHQDSQGTTHTSQVLRTGPIPCSTHLQEYTCWCPPAIPCRDGLPTCHLDHSATEDQEQGPLSRIGQRTTRRPSRSECFIPWLSLPDQVTILRWTNSLGAQWCQDPFGYPPQSSDKQPMDPTWLKSLEEDVTDKPVTTSASDTQMPWRRVTLDLAM